MKISVIVPVYNVESILHYCVDSILVQSFRDYELILVDDGSTDKSGEICDNYSRENEHITVIHNKNEGVSKARNTGIEQARGEYLCFVDSDDFISNTYLEELFNLKVIFPNCENIWCGFQTVDAYEKYQIQKKTILEKTKTISRTSKSSIMTLHEKWLDSGPVCKLYSKRIIEDNHLRFPEDLSLGEDLVFNYRYLDCTGGQIIILNKCLYNYVSNNDSLSKKYYFNMFEIYVKLNNFMRHYIKKWNCDCFEIAKYHNACFFKYEVVLKNTFCSESVIKNKYKYNRRILKSKEFKLAFENADCYIHPLYKLSYRLASYRLIRLLDLLGKIKIKF